MNRAFVIASTPNNRAIHVCYLDSENSFVVTLITRHPPPLPFHRVFGTLKLGYDGIWDTFRGFFSLNFWQVLNVKHVKIVLKLR